MRKHFTVTVKGSEYTWSFDIYGTDRDAEDWRSDGLDVAEIQNSFPEFIGDLGLVNIWCFFEDIFLFRNPFRKKR